MQKRLKKPSKNSFLNNGQVEAYSLEYEKYNMDQKEKEAFKNRVSTGQSIFKPACHFQTMHLCFEEICLGQSPWIPLGNFMNDWYSKHLNERESLIIDPLPEIYPQTFHQWAAFCAASARWFCSTYEIVSPSWIDNPQYILPEPWYMDKPSALWPFLLTTTAEEFVHHNIYCGNSLYTNKYERDEQGKWLQEHPVEMLERRKLARSTTARLRQQRAEQERWKQEDPPLVRARLAIARRNNPTVNRS